MPVTLRRPLALADPAVVVDESNYVLRNVSVIETGPALGHGFEVDATMLEQVAEQINAQPKGVKSRLTHPGLTECGGRDGIEVTLGRMRDARVDGDRVRADLHLGRFAAVTPQGDLRKYLMAIATEDPELAGVSIVFDPDEFESELVDEQRPESLESPDVDGKYVVRYGRSKGVLAGDIVGDPAANTSGLLSRLPSQIVSGITPELLARWADDLYHLGGAMPQKHQGAVVMNPQLRKYLESIGLAESATPEQAVMFWQKQTGDVRSKCDALATAAPASVPASQPAPAPEPQTAALTQADIDRARADALAAERERVNEIRALAQAQGLGDAWAAEQIVAGSSLQQAKDAALAAYAAQNRPLANVTVGADRGVESLRPAMVDAILLRAGVNQYEEDIDHGRPVLRRDESGHPVRRNLHERADRFRRLSLLDMYRVYLSQIGIDEAQSMGRAQLASLLGPRALRDAFPSRISLAQSVGDFGSILTDAITKSMRSLYLEREPQWRIFARPRTAPDFKNINVVALSESPDLAEVKTGGEVNYVQLGDTGEVYALVEYRGGIELTRRAIINDDLSAFERIPLLQANAARRKEDDVAFGVLTANAAMADTGLLFNTTVTTTAGGHANLVAGSGNVGAPTEATIQATETLLRKQKGPKNAARLNLEARFMIVPVEHAVAAQKFYVNNVLPGGTNDEQNLWRGRYRPVIDSRLSDSSVTAWYLLADYRDGQVDTIEVAMLEGEEMPVLKQETDFDTDDVRYQVRHTCAATAADFRGMVKNPGV